MKKEEVLQLLQKEKVRYLRLCFTDILGIAKNVEVPENQFERALDGEIMFDGSSIDGFTRIEESDMLLIPDFNTLLIYPWDTETGKTARLICDVYTPEGKPFEGCPRLALKRALQEAKDLGYEMFVGPEPEFFLFEMGADGRPVLNVHDRAGYFDLAPIDEGETVRKEITITLQKLGFEIEASHHECGNGQHEIDFKYDDALSTADKIMTFTFIVRKIAKKHGLYASFLPKPIFGIAGSGMHLNISLFQNSTNSFYDANGLYQLSNTALNFTAGVLKHAKAFVAVTNQLVNSYKRLQPGYEAPVNIAWSLKNRSPLIRIPASRGMCTRIEVRVPDPSANPYLAIAVLLKSGLDGIKNRLIPPPAVEGNIFEMSSAQKKRLKIDYLPSNLFEAVSYLAKDETVKEALGPHIYEKFREAKLEEWTQYSAHVSDWEINKYFGSY